MATSGFRRKSRARTRMRRAQWKSTPVITTNCPSCGAAARPHAVCTSCGQYRGRQVLVPRGGG